METEKSSLQELKQINEQIKSRASGRGGDDEELPAGADPLETVEPKVSASGEGDAVVVEVEDDVEELIVIGDKSFKTQKEAIRYAEKLEADKQAADAYNQGMRDTLAANAQPVEPVVEEDFDAKFYADPKKALADVKQSATQEAVAIIKAEQNKEVLWNKFLTKNPDVSREDAELILQRNFETIGKMTDVDKAMEALATKTRSYYQDIIDRAKPRKELPNKGGQAVSAGTSTKGGVTPKTEDKEPLDFISEMKRMRRR